MATCGDGDVSVVGFVNSNFLNISSLVEHGLLLSVQVSLVIIELLSLQVSLVIIELLSLQVSLVIIELLSVFFEEIGSETLS